MVSGKYSQNGGAPQIRWEGAPPKSSQQSERERVSPDVMLVIGLGNPILGDDGVGWVVARQVQTQWLEARTNGKTLNSSVEIEFDLLSLGGLSLMERLVGYRRAIIIDAISTGRHPVGTVHHLELHELPERAASHLSAAHDTSLQTALSVGRSLGAVLPDQITVVGIEADVTYEFSEQLSPPVAAAVPQAVQTVLNLLQQFTQTLNHPRSEQ